ncbi:MAG TPA: hypothetical protein VHT51_12980 [Micropepsaceae bacterium]|jgi:hypothetical protein|nr:hypothetical protein [Micropepsaceae bacterium]
MFTVAGYEKRAEECVRLANLTEDGILRAEILQLRQSYLASARRQKEIEKGGANRASASEAPAAKEIKKLRLGLKPDQR